MDIPFVILMIFCALVEYSLTTLCAYYGIIAGKRKLLGFGIIFFVLGIVASAMGTMCLTLAILHLTGNLALA